MRAIDPGMDSTVVAAIDARLADLAVTAGVKILHAIESGSRAWGFPSPDSDYDCRFLYARPLDQLLTPWPHRDVIETPLEGLLDVNGWDLAKAIKLLLKGNAVVLEWLTSPVVYRSDARFRDGFVDLANRVTDQSRIAAHYLHLGERQWKLLQELGDTPPIKKLLYALRPAAALRWLRYHPAARFPPMRFDRLIAESDPSPEVATLTVALVAEKARTREQGFARIPTPLLQFVEGELHLARRVLPLRPEPASPDAVAAATSFYRETILSLDS